jgi:hypothetical protein
VGKKRKVLQSADKHYRRVLEKYGRWMACGKAREGRMRCRKAGANNLLKVTNNCHKYAQQTLEKCDQCTDIM